MSSFTHLQSYSPWVVLLAGLVTFGAYLGTGLLILRRAAPDLPTPYREAVGVILGILIQSSVVQAAGFIGQATPPILIGSLFLFVGLGATAIFRLLRSHRLPSLSISRPSFIRLAPIAIIGAALAANLLVALAPSTKIDELNYHMLTPARVVQDGALRFYRYPIESAVPQTYYQLAEAPLHALGVPDAPNVLSFCLSALLCWAVWRRLRETAEGGMWAAALIVGLYSTVWHVTAGAHAFGDLAMVTAVLVLIDADALRRTISAQTLAGVLSLLLTAVVAAKISASVVAGILLTYAVWSLLRSHPHHRKAIVTAVCLPWLVFYTPLLIWTYIHSGSPLGPVLAGQFGPSAYDPVAAAHELSLMRAKNQVPFEEFVRFLLLNYSPLLCLGVLGCVGVLVGRAKPQIRRECLPAEGGAESPVDARGVVLVLAFTVQAVIIFRFLTQDPRFLGGLQLALPLYFAVTLRQRHRALLSTRWGTACLLLLLAPWCALQLYYARPFAAVVLGRTPKQVFIREYVAFYDDFQQLDRLLPANAVLFVPEYRIDAVYAPRPIVLRRLDNVPKTHGELYIFQVGSPGGAPSVAVPDGYVLAERVYENRRAIVRCFRTPGRPPALDTVTVFRLRPVS